METCYPTEWRGYDQRGHRQIGKRLINNHEKYYVKNDDKFRLILRNYNIDNAIIKSTLEWKCSVCGQWSVSFGTQKCQFCNAILDKCVRNQNNKI